MTDLRDTAFARRARAAKNEENKDENNSSDVVTSGSQDVVNEVKGEVIPDGSGDSNDEVDLDLGGEADNDGTDDLDTNDIQLFDPLTMKAWRKKLSDKTGSNSSLRIPEGEKRPVEDMVIELRRRYGYQVSINDLARLGLIMFTHDFRRRKSKSLILEVLSTD
jgi:hypothetical protein